MDNEIKSRVYRPNPYKCCERCVFGSGEHADWCMEGTEDILFVTNKKQDETLEEWAKKCAILKNVRIGE